eukprot:gene24124-18071_t
MATEVLTSLATELYEVVQTVKGNKERCKEIGERAHRLAPALRRVTSTPGDQATFEKSDLFGELESTLESAIELCSKYAGKHWLMKAFQGSADESRFDGIVGRLDAALADAQFGLQADVRAGQARWEEARQRDNETTQTLLDGQEALLAGQAGVKQAMDSGFGDVKELVLLLKQSKSSSRLSSGSSLGSSTGELPVLHHAWEIHRKELKKAKVWDEDEEVMVQCEPIGGGAQGSVFKGSWRGLDVAIKVMDLHDPKAFDREVSILSRLGHPNVCHFYGACKAKKGEIALELLSKSLYDAIYKDATPLTDKENMFPRTIKYVIQDCWQTNPKARPEFSHVSMKLTEPAREAQQRAAVMERYRKRL